MPSSVQYPLILRADASARIGTGHVMRCLALAQAWTAGPVTCASTELAPELERRLDEAGIRRVPVDAPAGSPADAAALGALCRAAGAVPAALVIDGYRFDAAYQRVLKAQGLRFLMFDDNGHAEHYAADWVLNQNLYAEAALYSAREPYTRLLLGCRYAVLRPEFQQARGGTRPVPERAARVLVTLGGGDPDNVTERVLEALARVGEPRLDVRVVAGPANPHRPALERALRGAAFQGQLLPEVREMPALMTWADLAVAAGGTTCWEMLCLGVPLVLLILADNQVRNVAALEAAGVACSLGWWHTATPAAMAAAIAALRGDSARRQAMGERGRALVDGAGAARVAAVVRAMAAGTNTEGASA